MDNNNENIKKLRELIKDMRFAMMRLIEEEDGTLRSRPMATQNLISMAISGLTYGGAQGR